MGLWWVFGVILFVATVWVIARVVSGTGGRADDSPEQILKRRYARGELDREEYQRRLEDLRR
jgi:putative membrane protein